jgi:ketosteroid isomerase-like protein
MITSLATRCPEAELNQSRDKQGGGFCSADAAEEAFYAAFAACDVRAMADVWAQDAVVCVHPGAAPVIGRGAVLRSWSHILLDAELPHLQTERLAVLKTDDLAVHLVQESIGPGQGSSAAPVIVVATNIYRAYSDGWRLFEHHASVSRLTTTSVS